MGIPGRINRYANDTFGSLSFADLVVERYVAVAHGRGARRRAQARVASASPVDSQLRRHPHLLNGTSPPQFLPAILLPTKRQSFAYVLYRLAVHPEYAQVLREEVDAVAKEEGWTKAAMQKMRKVDSFLKESQRVDGLGPSTLPWQVSTSA